MELRGTLRNADSNLKTKTNTATRPLISVIIPVYNVAPYLKRCVNSVLAQTFRNFELILVDDGSTDGSGQICDEYIVDSLKNNENDENYKNRLSPISDTNAYVCTKVIHQQNGGVSSARNCGIEAAFGEYISFIDADDWLAPSFLEAFANEIKCHPGVDLVVQGFWDHDGIAQTELYSHFSDIKSFCSELYRLEEKKLIGYVWNKLFRKAIIIENHIVFNLQIPIGEDWLFCISYINVCKSTSIINNVGYHYSYNGPKEYSFKHLNNRLDTFYHHIVKMQSIPCNTKDALLFNEYKFALYILHVLYAERHTYQKRSDFLKKIKLRRNAMNDRASYSLESPYKWLSLMVMYLPHGLCDLLLQIIFPRQKA